MALSDWESDLTDLSSSEEEYVPQKKKGNRKVIQKEEYKITNALRPPRTTTYTAKCLYDQIVDSAIDLDAEYQRDVVWPDVKQSGLIDSILRNYYIPPIIFAVTASDDGTETRVCIDGKQRLTSIQRFMDGLISHKDSYTNQRFWYKQGGGQKRALLPKQYMQKFANKQITCVEYDCLTGDQEREIFQRVQLGVALTPAERMKAITGPWPALIREIQSKVLGDDGFGDDFDWGRTRGRDFQCLASIVYLIHHHPSGKFPGAAQLDKWLQSTAAVPPKLRTELLETFRIFVDISRDEKHNEAFQRPTRVSPIEFTMTGVLIHFNKEKLSMTQFSSAISKMRTDVRGKWADIRSNAKVTKTMWTFITKGLKISGLQSDGKGDIPAAKALRSQSAPKKTKRKRAVASSDDESDADQRPVPSKMSRAAPAPIIKSKEASKPPAKSASKPVTKSTPSSAKTPASKKKPAKQSTTGSSMPAGSSITVVSTTARKTAQGLPTMESQPVPAPNSTRDRQPSSNLPATKSTGSGPQASEAPTATMNQAQSSVGPAPPITTPSPLLSTAPQPEVAQSAIKQSPPPPLPRVKAEPGSEAPSTSAQGNKCDLLASIRAARANSADSAGPGSHSLSPITTSLNPITSQMSPTLTPTTLTSPNSFSTDSTMGRQRLPPLDTASQAPPPLSRVDTVPISPATGTLPTGTRLDQASIEKILANHGYVAKQPYIPPTPVSAAPPPSANPGYTPTVDPRLAARQSPLISPTTAPTWMQQNTASSPSLPTSAGSVGPSQTAVAAPPPKSMPPPVPAARPQYPTPPYLTPSSSSHQSIPLLPTPITNGQKDSLPSRPRSPTHSTYERSSDRERDRDRDRDKDREREWERRYGDDRIPKGPRESGRERDRGWGPRGGDGRRSRWDRRPYDRGWERGG